MGTIRFSGHFTPREQSILAKTFKSNCERLGIEKHDFSVNAVKNHMDNPGHMGAIARMEKDEFMLILNSNEFNLFTAISVLGHETVHIEQHLTGKMREGDDIEGVEWKGTHYPRFICQMKAAYKDLPWEKEAFGRQEELHRHALRNLSRDDRGHVLDSSRWAFEDN